MIWPALVAVLIAYALIGAIAAVAVWPRIWRSLPPGPPGRRGPRSGTLAVAWLVSLGVALAAGAAWPATLPWLARRPE
jgi:hypothetical protein